MAVPGSPEASDEGRTICAMEHPDEHVLRRLALVRELYLRSEAASREPEQTGGLSLLGFQDAVEMFLLLAAQYVDATLKASPNFEDYWEPINKKLPDNVELSGRTKMRALNKARVSLKHHGVLPAHEEINRLRTDTTAFLDENTRRVFGVEFDDIDMAELVAYEKVRALLDEAKEQADRDDVQAALASLAVAFAWALKEFRARSRSNAFSGWADISPAYVSGGDLADEVSSALSDLASEVSTELARLEDALEVVAFGIDLRRWQRFRSLTPWVVWSGDDFKTHGRNSLDKLGLEDVSWVRAFVIESALRLQALAL